MSIVEAGAQSSKTVEVKTSNSVRVEPISYLPRILSPQEMRFRAEGERFHFRWTRFLVGTTLALTVLAAGSASHNGFLGIFGSLIVFSVTLWPSRTVKI